MNVLELERLQGRSLSHESHTGRLAPKRSWAQVVRGHQEDPVNIGPKLAELPNELLVQLAVTAREPLEVICAMAHLSKAFCEAARTAQGLLEQADFRKWQRMVDDAAVAGVVSKCPQLSSLSLSYCGNITDLAVMAVASGCPQLSSLSLGGCSNITDVAVMAVASGCPQLSSLDLTYCYNITDAAVVALVSGCQLTTLSLSSCFKTTDLTYCYNITDAAVVAVALGCPQLSSLNLPGCSNITDAAVVAVASGCPQLSSLSLGGCRNITDAAVVAVASGCPQLSSLSLWGLRQSLARTGRYPRSAYALPTLWARALAVQSREVSVGNGSTTGVTAG